jgi:hypothetical protein
MRHGVAFDPVSLRAAVSRAKQSSVVHRTQGARLSAGRSCMIFELCAINSRSAATISALSVAIGATPPTSAPGLNSPSKRRGLSFSRARSAVSACLFVCLFVWCTLQPSGRPAVARDPSRRPHICAAHACIEGRVRHACGASAPVPTHTNARTQTLARTHTYTRAHTIRRVRMRILVRSAPTHAHMHANTTTRVRRRTNARAVDRPLQAHGGGDRLGRRAA